MKNWLQGLKTTGVFLFIVVLILLVGPPDPPPGDEITRIRAYSRPVEFDFAGWIANAFWEKSQIGVLGVAGQLTVEEQHDLVLEYLALIRDIKTAEAELSNIYADPQVSDPEKASAALQAGLEQDYARRAEIGPLVEAILQDMLTAILKDEGFTWGGQPIPPIRYQATPLPWALIISPRDHIEQKTSISLEVDLNVVDHVELENAIEAAFPEISALVVPIGGLGAYPTMVAETTSFNWQMTVIAHEWIHNYLTLRPLGMLYGETPALRTMNETTASLAGDELGANLIERFFPELVPPPPTEPADTTPTEPVEPAPPVFDFRAEMHETRVQVDELLAAGEIEAAETYMEARRLVFWENGYHIRRINQAYFAFYGAYADTPGGAAGEDPVGAAVRELRAQSDTLIEFVNRISWLTSFEALQQLVSK